MAKTSEKKASKKKASSDKKTSAPKKEKQDKFYLIVQMGELYFVPEAVLEGLTATEALSFGIQTCLEQPRQLLRDALLGDQYVNQIKVIDGLRDSLLKFQELFPWINEQINYYAVDSKIGRA